LLKRYWNVKSSNRQKLADKVSQRIKEIKRAEPEPEQEERTGRDTINLLVGLEKPSALEEKIEPEREIILYLKDGVNPANSNFTKYPNEMHPMMVEKLRDMSEEVLYIYLWRESWGWGRNYCRTSYRKIFNNTLLGSTKTAQRAIESLLLKKFIIKNLLEESRLDINRQGTLYRVLTPEEIISGKTEEGVDLEIIPVEGIVMVSTEMKSIDIKSMDTKSIVHDVHINDDYNSVENKSLDIMSMESVNTDYNRENSLSGNSVHGNNDHPLKEESLKDSLSPRDIIYSFYRGIGQKRVTKAKRERAEKCLKELLDENFTLEDIQFAIEWTQKNSKEDIYDFSIITHTISQAMSDKERIEKEKTRRLEREKAELERQEDQKREEEELAEIKAYKGELSKEEREELRKKAVNEIEKMEGVKREFVSEILVEAKENEILKAQMDNE
jgi:hypothetical protein